MRIVLTILACISMLGGGCKGGSEEMKKLDKDIMAVHDEAMKEMADMNRVSREIKKFMTTALMTPEQSQKFTEVLTNIEKAESDMMSWMREYDFPKDKPQAEAMAYLQDQLVKITKNRDDIHAAHEAGKQLLPQQ